MFVDDEYVLCLWMMSLCAMFVDDESVLCLWMMSLCYVCG